MLDHHDIVELSGQEFIVDSSKVLFAFVAEELDGKGDL